MKRLSLIFLCIFFDVSSMVRTTSAGQKNKFKNSSSYFTSVPSAFGITHFVMGPDGKHLPTRESEKNTIFAVHNKQSLLKDTKAVTTDVALSNTKTVISDAARLIDKNLSAQVFFSRSHDLFSIVLHIISEAKKVLYIAAFSLTNHHVANAVIAAHKRNVDVCIVIDASNRNQPYSKVDMLINADIPVWCYKPKNIKSGLSAPLMHQKFIIVDDFVAFGSVNLTNAGLKDNSENLTIQRQKHIVDAFYAEMESLKRSSVKCALLATA